MTTLLAKSRSHGELTLQQHLRDTEQAAQALFRPGSRWGARWPAFLRLKVEHHAQFLLELRVAALFHDIGKANEDFQLAVSSQGFRPQTLRHEHVSALVMSLPTVRTWLSAGAIDVDVCCAAVLSHHLKATEPEGEHPWAVFSQAPRLKLALDHPQVLATLHRIREVLGLGPPPPLPTGFIDTQLLEPWGAALRTGLRAARDLRRSLRSDPERRRRLVAVKVGLIVADAAASGLFRTGNGIEPWVERNAHSAPLSAQAIAQDVIAPRLAAIGKNGPAQLHPFQVLAAQAGERALLLAACGTGKTLAAWKWAETQARERGLGRIIFLYPTRGTATEGFRDYAAWAPEGEALLLHGTADYELEQMLENPPESAAGKALAQTEAEERLFALGTWGRRYISATVDQFLAAMAHRYESLCLLPALADSAVVIDEVHSFDRKMFGALVAFLKEFDVPTLCMTATLPSGRREQLVELGLRTFPAKEDASALRDLAAKEQAPRYRLSRVVSAPDAETRVLRAVADGRRVLWVVNQVARAQARAVSLATQLGQQVLCYHSRFRLGDRQRAHASTVSAFQQSERCAIAVTTQVCEMSLDLDADLLVTEECPVTSLVQRFGRANRHLRRPGVLADLITYPADGERPYARADLAGVSDFLGALDGREFCQAELAERLANLGLDETRASGSSSLFDSGYYAVPADFRDLDEFARPAVLTSDLDQAVEEHRAGRSLARLLVPVPRRFVSDLPAGVRLPAWLGVADSANYQPGLGFIAPEKERA